MVRHHSFKHLYCCAEVVARLRHGLLNGLPFTNCRVMTLTQRKEIASPVFSAVLMWISLFMVSDHLREHLGFPVGVAFVHETDGTPVSFLKREFPCCRF